jgi:hypothetical protein
MTGRREERRGGAAPLSQARTNEYFVPKEGIDREVITADICRYLGNDALVRPGNYQNQQTGQVQAGYFITAYRNLTTAMIADLKADSDRWEQERRASTTGGRAPNGTSSRDSNGIIRISNAPIVGYRDSTTHQSRQYYGPTEPPGATPGGYTPTSGVGPSQAVYDNPGPQYQQQQSYVQPATGYANPQGYPIQGGSYYVSGANYEPRVLETEVNRPSMPAPQSNASVPRNVYSSTTPTYTQQPDNRPSYYSPGPVAAPPTQYATQPTDPYYGRVAGSYDPQDQYGDRGYQETGAYPQTTIAPSGTIPAPANTGSRRRESEREPESSRHRDHRNRR